MFERDKENKKILKYVIAVLCLLTGILFCKVFQTPVRTARIYKEALNDYNNGNFSNSYYLFSKISILSGLKPVAMYRQALCAEALGDKRSELKIYQAFLRRYPVNKLAPEIRYEAGQLLIDTKPNTAKRYFSSVVKSDNIDEDYKIASQYYIARIAAANIRYSGRKVSKEKSAKIEQSFRGYLEKYPDGRLAQNVAGTWLKYNENLRPEDKVLTAKAYYFAKSYDKSKKILEKTEDKESWTIKALNAFALKDYETANKLVQTGVSSYSQYAAPDDYKKAVDEYIKVPENSVYDLFKIAKGAGKDYLWNLKCEDLSQEAQAKCYSELYSNFPDGEFAQNALFNVFSYSIKNKQYINARTIGKDYLLKFPDTEETPMVMFWMGKISQNVFRTSEFVQYYQNIINNYPDNYYAYRAFWLLKGIKSGIIRAELSDKPIVYPYKFPRKGGMLYNLISVNDYDMISKYTKDDFIKSWAEYQKGNYAVSAHLAQKAMEQIKEKPVKTDLRWRLVYPLNYYKQVKSTSLKYGNNDALIMALIREESFFNMNAQSEAGAIGLMQLMPSTAHEIGAKNGITFNNMGLLNPELNIKLGNLYYSSLRSLLKDDDVYLIAAYNGGADSVKSWKNSRLNTDIDEFVEQIPYPETQNYVKKVFRSYWNYVRIYQR